MRNKVLRLLLKLCCRLSDNYSYSIEYASDIWLDVKENDMVEMYKIYIYDNE